MGHIRRRRRINRPVSVTIAKSQLPHIILSTRPTVRSRACSRTTTRMPTLARTFAARGFGRRDHLLRGAGRGRGDGREHLDVVRRLRSKQSNENEDPSRRGEQLSVGPHLHDRGSSDKDRWVRRLSGGFGGGFRVATVGVRFGGNRQRQRHFKARHLQTTADMLWRVVARSHEDS